MCGITGIVLKTKISREELNDSVQSLMHRGPDGNGIFVSEDEKIGFGHSRLSFIELSDSGKQPFKNDDDSLVITFNGEIYNYLEIQFELIELGITFQTQTDTEVILKAYEYWGEEMMPKLKGMFAFAIYNRKENSIFICRDRFGIKPLYYFVSNCAFAFGSELKALFTFSEIPKKIRRESVATFLANRYVPVPHTIWENIFQVPAANYLKINLENFEFQLVEYWKLKFDEKIEDRNQTGNEINAILTNAVRQHLISDVQVGTFLSGGIDSSLLSLKMKELDYKPLDAFTIGFDDWDKSEHFFARKVAESLHFNLHEALEESFTLDSVNHLMYHYDNPIADISILPTFSVSRLARKNVKAVLSGEGADECFAGYWWQQPAQFQFQSKFEKVKSKFFGIQFDQIKSHYIQANSMGLFDFAELKEAFSEDWQPSIPKDPFAHINKFQVKGISTLKQIQYLDLKLFMSELVLAKIDRASMANSLEARVPFLDHDLVEKVFSLAQEQYFDPNKQKTILRNMLVNKVPSEIYDRKKQGFVGPDKFYENTEVYAAKLTNGRLINEGVINSKYIQKLIENNDTWRLWKLFVLENWWEQWM
jgi:asparagine synthase (glutamine-hydrolysing)